MLVYVLRRLLVAFSVMLTVAVVSFMLLHLSGDLATAIAGPEASAADVEKVRVQYGLDRPIASQFADWLGAAVRLDFGRSFYFQNSVMELVGERLPVTLKLGGVALLLAVIVAIPLGVLAALYRDSWVDRGALLVAVVGQAMPNFWFALTLVLVFAVGLKWLPVAGNTSWLHFVLPAVALGYYAMPSLMRLTRAGMLDVLGADYIRTARAKGLSPARVVFKHALRNAIIPVVTVVGLQMGALLSGAIVVETVFAWPGIGRLTYEALTARDYPVLMAMFVFVGILVVIANLVTDLTYAFLDPRIRYQ